MAIAAMVAAAAIYAWVASAMFGDSDHWIGSPGYATIAANFLDGYGYTSDRVHPTVERPPGYPLILMGAMLVSEKRWFAVTVLLQALATVACLLFVFEIASLLWPRSPAPWLALGLLVLDGPFMVEMTALRETVWFTLGLLGLAWLLVGPAGAWREAAALGLCSAAVYLLRPTGLMTALVTFAILGRTAWSTGNWRTPAVAILTAAALATPWQIYTWRTFGAPGYFPSSQAAYSFCKGMLPEIPSVYPWIDADRLDGRTHRLVAGIPIEDQQAVDAQYMKVAWANVGRSPGAALGHMAVNALAFVSPWPIPLGQGRLIETEAGVTIRGFKLDWKALPFTPLVLLLLVAGGLGVIALLRSGGTAGRFGLWMTVLFAVFWAIHTVTFVKTRYRLPLDALLAVAAGGWLERRGPAWLRRWAAQLAAAGSPDR